MSREAITDAVLVPSVVTNLPATCDTLEPATPPPVGLFGGKHTTLYPCGKVQCLAKTSIILHCCREGHHKGRYSSSHHDIITNRRPVRGNFHPEANLRMAHKGTTQQMTSNKSREDQNESGESASDVNRVQLVESDDFEDTDVCYTCKQPAKLYIHKSHP